MTVSADLINQVWIVMKKRMESGEDARTIMWANTPFVSCDIGCCALKEPKTLHQMLEAYMHWKDHKWQGGCAHGHQPPV